MNQSVTIVTGASGSMGKQACKALALRDENVIMACRNLSKAQKVRDEILSEEPSIDGSHLEIRSLDLGDLSSVERFVQEMKANGITVKALFNNAGIIAQNYSKTPDGYETMIQTNCIAPLALTRGLLPLMQEGSHIVNMVSLTCSFASFDDRYDDEDPSGFTPLGTYARSKLALLVKTVELASELEGRGIFVNVADPGIVNSNMISMHKWFDPIADILFRPFCRTPQNGVKGALRALYTDRNLYYFTMRGEKPISGMCRLRKYLKDNKL